MVCSGALGFILLFLLHPALGVVNLGNIINYLFDDYGHNNQFALGINVEYKYCQQGARLNRNFLPKENKEKVKSDMAGADRIYRGTRLIGARPKPIPGTRNNYHAEYLLLVKSMSKTLERFDPLMQKLLKEDPEGCTIFYTLNSPCVKTCSTPNKPNSIIKALEMFRDRDTPKAFVFRRVWDYDVDNSDWENNLLVINKIIPVFRCDEYGCVRCVYNNRVNQCCKRN